MTNNTNTQAVQQQPKSNDAVKRFEMFAGEWDIEITMPTNPPTMISGRASFELLEGGAFLKYRSEIDRSDFPKGISFFGSDDTLDTYSMIYYDSRGVSRIYEMSLNDREWKLWRNAPGFSQRFTGTFGDNGNTITAFWEKSTDGTKWELDFDLTYRRVG